MPARQLNETQAALESARSVEADIYSSEAFHSAQAAFKQAQVELAEQERKPFYSRKYDRADRLLLEAQSRAQEAAAAAADNRERARTAAQSAEYEAQKSIDAATKRLRSVGKRPGKELDLLAGDLRNAEESLREAQAAYTQGRFMDALNQFLAADEKAKAVVVD